MKNSSAKTAHVLAVDGSDAVRRVMVEAVLRVCGVCLHARLDHVKWVHDAPEAKARPPTWRVRHRGE